MRGSNLSELATLGYHVAIALQAACRYLGYVPSIEEEQFEVYQVAVGLVKARDRK